MQDFLCDNGRLDAQICMADYIIYKNLISIKKLKITFFRKQFFIKI